jgi:hypothetical protein
MSIYHVSKAFETGCVNHRVNREYGINSLIVSNTFFSLKIWILK